MAGNSDNERPSRRENRDHVDPIQNPQSVKPQYGLAGADRNPSPPQLSYYRAPRSIREPQPHGHTATPPDSNVYGAPPFPPTQSPYYCNYPTETMSSHTQKPRAYFHPQLGSTDRFDGRSGYRGSSLKEGVSNSSGPVPSQRSTSALSRFTTLEDEYATLYRKRHEIGVQMEDIKRSLTAERYTALMAELDPQELATLKTWSDNADN